MEIDRPFVAASGTATGRAVVEGVVDPAHGVGASVIAEGVETWEQLDELRATPGDAVTGFLLGRPVPAGEQHLTRARLSSDRSGATAATRGAPGRSPVR